MKKTLEAALFTAFVLAAFTLESCELSNDMIYTSQVHFVKSSYQGYPYYFVGDDSTLMLPANGAGFTIDADNGQRMTISWKTDEKDLESDPLVINVTGYSTLYQSATMLSNEPDTLGADPAALYLLNTSIPYLYKTGGIYGAPCAINIGFYYTQSDSSIIHEVYLSYTSDPVDEDGYFHLCFSHDANGDSDLSTVSALFAFILPEAAYTAEVNGLVITFDGLDNDPEAWKYTYATGKTEEIPM